MAKATRAEWAKRVERWQDSGLTAKEFASELEVSPSSLTFWKWKLRQIERDMSKNNAPANREKRRAAEPAPQFLQLVPTSDSSSSTASLELVLANDVLLRVPKDFDEPALVRLVHLLGGR